jgi:hypothetical protein
MQVILLLQREQALACQTGLFGDHGTIRFTNSKTGVEEFKRYLLQHREAGFVILLDHGDEQYYWHGIARMQRTDQQAVLRNQQNKLFGDSPYVSSIVDNSKSPSVTRLGVAHIGRPADTSACAWLTEIERADSYVKSFHWMSLLAYACVKACIKPMSKMSSTLKVASAAVTIAIVRIDTNDDRVMAFRSNSPLICRRVGSHPPGTVIPSQTGQVLADHLQQTISYLTDMADNAVGTVATESATFNSAVRVVVVGRFNPDEIDAVQSKCSDSGIPDVAIVPASTLVKILAKKGIASDSVIELLMQSVLRRGEYRYSFIFRGARYVQRKVRHALYAASISLLFGAVAVSAGSRHIENEMQSLKYLASDLEEKSSQLRQVNQHPEWSTRYPVDAIRESASALKAVEASADEVAPLHFIVSVSEQLTRYPEISLLSVSWERDDNLLFGGATAQGNSHQGRTAEVQDSAVGTGEFNAIVTGVVSMDAQGEAVAMGRFRAFVGSIRESAIAAAPGSRVIVIGLPFTESGATTRAGGHVNGEFRLEVMSRRSEP